MGKSNTIFGHKSRVKWKPKVEEPKVLKMSTQTIINNTINQTIHRNKIDVIITSVNYNDFLILSLENNTKYFENITVVTSNDDKICQDICENYGVKCITTDVFYEDGFKFNKGKAINVGIESIINPEFILLLDADIIVTNKIELTNLEPDTLYTSDRWICYNHFQYERWRKGETQVNNLPKYERDNGYGFFQLFNFNNSIGINRYNDELENSSHPDLKFSSYFPKKQTIDVDIIHLGYVKKNWDGRKSEKFLTDEQFSEMLGRKSTYKICSFYYNFRGDSRQKTNFIKFLDQWKGHYDKLIVGLVDYEDGDLDFEIPCEKIIIKGDKENKLWSKEILINNIIDKIDTDYLLWIDGDIIYNNLDWLNNIDDVTKGNDFIQLFETINYFDEKGNITNVFKSIASGNKKNVDHLLSKGFRPGGAWVGRTSILKEKNLFEKMYVGGGDTIFTYGLYKTQNGQTLKEVQKYNSEIYKEANQWINNFGDYKVGYLNETVNHLYHGDLKDRNYNGRYLKLGDLNKEIKYSENVDEINIIIDEQISQKKEIVVYTSISGNYDLLKEVVCPEKNIEYICFTDQEIESETWKIKKIPEILNNLEQTKKARCLKILPHLFLQEYETSVWVDGNIQVKRNMKKFINDNLKNNFAIAKHPDRICVYQESEAVKQLKKDKHSTVDSQIEFYKESGYPEKNGMVQSGVIIRKHNEKDCIEICNDWWKELIKWSKRDQLSFNYSIYNKNMIIDIFNPSIISSDYFDYWTHKGQKAKLRNGYGTLKNYINGKEV